MTETDMVNKKNFDRRMERLFIFGGQDEELDDMIIDYVKINRNNKNGVTYAQFENYFVFRSLLASEQTFRRRLCNLVKNRDLLVEECRGLKFYKLPLKEVKKEGVLLRL